MYTSPPYIYSVVQMHPCMHVSTHYCYLTYLLIKIVAFPTYFLIKHHDNLVAINKRILFLLHVFTHCISLSYTYRAYNIIYRRDLPAFPHHPNHPAATLLCPRPLPTCWRLLTLKYLATNCVLEALRYCVHGTLEGLNHCWVCYVLCVVTW